MGATNSRHGPAAPFPWLAHRARRPAPREIVPGLIAERELVLLIGDPGCGKSFALAHIASRVSAGLPLWGRPTTAGPVIFVALERDFLTGARLDAAAEEIGEHDPAIAMLSGPLNLTDPTAVDHFIMSVGATLAERPEEAGPPLIIIDTLARASVGADEMSARDMGRVLAAVDAIVQGTGAAVVIAHHTSRRGTDPRGSSALEGAADRVVRISVGRDGTRQIDVQKNNAGAVGDRLHFRITDLGLSEISDSLAAVPVDHPSQLSEARLSPDCEMALSVLGRLQNGGGSVSLNTWRAAVADEMTGRTAAARRQAWGRIVKTLSATGAVQISGNVVSIAGSDRRDGRDINRDMSRSVTLGDLEP
jgi:predicted ATP-dependent serine protease